MLVFKTTTERLAILLRADEVNDRVELHLGEQVGPGFWHRWTHGLSAEEAGELAQYLEEHVDSCQYRKLGTAALRINMRVKGTVEFNFGSGEGMNTVEVETSVADNMSNMIVQLLDHLVQARRDNRKEDNSLLNLKPQRVERSEPKADPSYVFEGDGPSTTAHEDQFRSVLFDMPKVDATPRDMWNYMELKLAELRKEDTSLRDQLGALREVVNIILRAHPEIVNNLLAGEDDGKMDKNTKDA